MSLSVRLGQRPSSKATAGTRAPRSRLLIFLGVLVLHVAAVAWLVRSNQGLRRHDRVGGEPLVFLLLPKAASVEAPPAATAAVAAAPSVRRKRAAATEPQNNAITLPAETPPVSAPASAVPRIDWDQEAQRAAKNALSELGTEDHYRNLAGLSAEQLKFVRDNHLVPMAPGIVWSHPRVEVDPKTLLPIIHINDHCVLVLLIPFCGIGHIKPNDHLFDHMHDKTDP
jgi:hypothetical protein